MCNSGFPFLRISLTVCFIFTVILFVKTLKRIHNFLAKLYTQKQCVLNVECRDGILWTGFNPRGNSNPTKQFQLFLFLHTKNTNRLLYLCGDISCYHFMLPTFFSNIPIFHRKPKNWNVQPLFKYVPSFMGICWAIELLYFLPLFNKWLSEEDQITYKTNQVQTFPRGMTKAH